MADVENIEVGVVQVFLDFGLGEIDLGHTNGGVTLNLEREFLDLVVDKYGTTPVDKALIGNMLSAELMLAEPTKENLNRAITESVINTGSQDTKIGIGRKAGYKLSQRTAQLRLHPVVNAANDLSKDIYIFKAVSSEPIELVFRVDEQRDLPVTFTALVDESKPDGYLLGRIGPMDIS